MEYRNRDRFHRNTQLVHRQGHATGERRIHVRMCFGWGKEGGSASLHQVCPLIQATTTSSATKKENYDVLLETARKALRSIGDNLEHNETLASDLIRARRFRMVIDDCKARLHA